MSDEGPGGTCTYTHELDSGTWHCPHDVEHPIDGQAVDGASDGSDPSADHCVFHRSLDETDPGAAAAALRDRIDSRGRRCKEFVGATFHALDLAFARVDAPDNHPVNLVDARVAGEFRLTSGVVAQPLVLDGLTVEGGVDCENATFGAECAIAGAYFGSGVDFQGATFQQRIRLEGAAVAGPANFHAVEFDESADFERTDFAGPVDVARAEFAGEAVFTGVRVAGPFDAEAVRVEGKADFRAVRFGGPVVLHDATFRESVAFGVASEDDRSTVEVRHHGGRRSTAAPLEFEGVLEHVEHRDTDPVARSDRVVGDEAPHFAGETDFVDAAFAEEVRFERVVFGSAPELRDVDFRDSVSFRAPRVESDSGDADGADDPDSGETTEVIDLRESHLAGGHLGQADDGTVVYDLEGATLGDVRIEGGRGAPFEHCRLLHTTFDGFDFGRYRDSVAAADWQIHTTLRSLDRPEPSRGDLEATYLKAKNGADARGDDRAGAEFFRKEQRHRRRGYRHRMRTADGVGRRLLAAARWLANALLKVSSGYGARPSRVVLFSLAIVVGFAPAFRLLRPEPPYPSFPRLGYLFLSFESFATGVRKNGPTLTDPQVHALSEIEAFVGAFMIALFVFTLTRSINR